MTQSGQTTYTDICTHIPVLKRNCEISWKVYFSKYFCEITVLEHGNNFCSGRAYYAAEITIAIMEYYCHKAVYMVGRNVLVSGFVAVLNVKYMIGAGAAMAGIGNNADHSCLSP